jgi:hypothetical protein
MENLENRLDFTSLGLGSLAGAAFGAYLTSKLGLSKPQDLYFVGGVIVTATTIVGAGSVREITMGLSKLYRSYTNLNEK